MKIALARLKTEYSLPVMSCLINVFKMYALCDEFLMVLWCWRSDLLPAGGHKGKLTPSLMSTHRGREKR
jgi:hypothetical protein